MALEVASLLDGVSFGKDHLGQAVAGMNKALSLKRVALESNDKCSVIVTIGSRSYHFLTSSGVLQISALDGGPDCLKALSKCEARVVIDPVAFNNESGAEAWEEALKERRKMYIEGDEAKYVLLHNALLNHISSLSAAIPATARAAQAKLVMPKLGDIEPPPFELAHLTDDTIVPPMQKVGGWLMFSALSTMLGNMGQSNYVASNQVLDVLTFYSRQQRPDFQAITMMWGTVGHIGMRWKAFASADAIYKDPNAEDIVMTPAQAQEVLKTIFTSELPEWFVANRFDKAMTEFLRNGGPSVAIPSKKGKGGGSFVDGEGSFPEYVVPAEKTHACTGKTALEGRRVRLHGLSKSPEMNGKKGTLLEELEDGTWIVRLDGTLGDKKLKLHNMMTLSGTPLGVGSSM
jgi:hypothetical protein|mmetsp:Transcript_87518/g.137016  ORF Transcript_87518/g.137016 Transcript_87518/m.137016 type:complete len:403 (+) Transcript_87518:81-1289(+)